MFVFVVLKCPDNNLQYNKTTNRRGTQDRTCIRPATARTLVQCSNFTLCIGVYPHIYISCSSIICLLNTSLQKTYRICDLSFRNKSDSQHAEETNRRTVMSYFLTLCVNIILIITTAKVVIAIS